MIAVLDYGIGNLASAQKALVHVGADAQLVTRPELAEGADAIVLPGVGAFGACMDALRASRLDEVVYDAIASNLPFLGICVGLQMLCVGSDESPDAKGLGVFDARVRLMNGEVKLPQMQWNKLNVHRPSPLLAGIDDESWFYFVHSYAADLTEADDHIVATCDYGGDVVAMMQRDRLWATQFHPEKSSTAGLRLLRAFVAEVESR